MVQDTFQLGQEPSVDHLRSAPKKTARIYNPFNIHPFDSLRRMKKTNEEATVPVVPARICPDQNLYEDIVEIRHARVKSPECNRLGKSLCQCVLEMEQVTNGNLFFFISE